MDTRPSRGRGRGGRERGQGGRGRGFKRPRDEGQSGYDDNNTNWQSRNGRTRRRHPPNHPRGDSNSNDNESKALPAEPPKCSVCLQAENPKYKCPKCREAYCSIACCQQHKLSCSTRQTLPTTSTTDDGQRNGDVKSSLHSKYLPPAFIQCNDVNEEASHFREGRGKDRRHNHQDDDNDDNEDDDDDLEDGWKITDAMKESMNRCDWLKRELQDPGLRQLITQTVAASRIVQHNGKTAQENILATNKTTNPMFSTFCDKLLVVTGILERQGQEQGQNNDVHNNNNLEDWLNRQPDQLGQLVLKPIPRQRPRPIDIPKVEEALEESEESSSAESSSEDSSEDSSSDDDDNDDDDSSNKEDGNR